jgi:hypothetical protein
MKRYCATTVLSLPGISRVAGQSGANDASSALGPPTFNRLGLNDQNARLTTWRAAVTSVWFSDRLMRRPTAK